MTTIDTLQIEIQTGSTNAAKGIQELSTALAGLKSNGKITTAVNNLNSLRKALHSFSGVPSNASKVLSLADSLAKLKSVGSVTSIGTGLTKLATSLKTLDTVTVDRGKIDSIADALGSLSNVKAGGINTMMNGLMKLDKVTKSLSDDAIDAFAKRVEVLTDKLEPLSKKMTTVQAGFKGINSAAKGAGSSIKKAGEDVDGATVNFAGLIYTIQEAVQWLQAAIEKMAAIMEQAIEWDGIAARFGRGFGAEAQETYEWIQKLNKEMGINVQTFMQYSSVYATMLTGFGVAHKDATKMALGYTELTYDIWAGYNDIYKNFEDAAEAVRSAIAGEVEPVRRAGFTIVEATLAQTAANHGLEISLETATEAQKSYLRYLTLVDQAHAQGLVGTYAKELNTAEGLVRTFTQQLKSLTQAFGSLFLPILVKIMPYMQAFVELLTEGVHWIAGLLGVEIQKVDFSGYEAGAGAIEDVANSAGAAADNLGSATKAAKELKNATLGIDELNVISPPSASGGAGAGAGGAGSNGFEGLDIDSLWDDTIFDDIQSDVDAIKEKLRGWMPVIGVVAAGLAGLSLLKLITDLKKVKALVVDSGIITAFSKIGTTIRAIFGALSGNAAAASALTMMFPKISAAVSTLGGWFTTAATAVGTFTAGLTAPAWALIAAALVAVGSAIYFVVENFEEIKTAFKDFFAENIAPKIEEIGKHFEKIKEMLGPLWDDILAPMFEGIKKFFASINIEVVLQGIGKAFEWLGGIVFSFISGPIMGLFNAIASKVEGIVQILSGVIQFIRGLIDIVVGIFTLDGKKISEGWDNIWSGIVDVVKGAYDLTIGAVVEFVEGIIDWFVEMWDVLVGHSIVPDTINDIVKWFTGLPGKVLGAIGNFVKDVIGKFASLGSGIAEKFSSAWNAVKSWWKKKPSLPSFTPSIGSIKEKLSSAWNTAKTWWSKSKAKLSTYTPSIGSIKDKISSAWTTAKNWWNKSKAKLSYTPSIGSIKDRLSAAWKTAKNWWSKNVKLSIPSLNFKVTYSKATGWKKAITKALGLDGWPKLSFAAAGGVFDTGSLVWAGERGPEVLANAGGGRTGVMNVQQMQDAVYEGVYAAVVAAMSATGGNGSQEVKVYLDGRQITAAVEQRQRERGAGIMGKQVYAY